jgi:hypothetical protein
MNVIQLKTEQIIEKSYKIWIAREKTKIRYNFAEDIKRTWNSIKQPAGQATKINPENLETIILKTEKFSQ